MKNLKVLFIYPNFPGMNMLPPAIAFFPRLLKDIGVEVKLFDTTYYKQGNFDSDKMKEKNLSVRPFKIEEKIEIKDADFCDDLDRLISEYTPDLVAMSVTQDMYSFGLELLNHIRKHDVLSVIGGVCHTFCADNIIKEDAVDIVCIGEGEDSLVELCEKLMEGKESSQIKNLWVKTKDGIVKNQLRAARDIDDLPLLDFSIFEKSRFYRPMAGKAYNMFPVETHRGCPYMCTFCNSPSRSRLCKTIPEEHFSGTRALLP